MRTSITLPDELYQHLQTLAERELRTVAAQVHAIIRDAVRTAGLEEASPLPRRVTAMDLARQAEEDRKRQPLEELP